jgi:antitoxin ParD1/3/4
MATMNVSLPDQMKAWVELRTSRGRYANASDYVRDLIRQDREREEALSDLRTLIQQGIDSGVSEQSFDEIIGEARAETDAAERA